MIEYLKPFNPATMSPLRSWTFPAYQHLLSLTPTVRRPDRGDRRPIQPIAFVSFATGDTPTGLVLGCVPSGPSPAELDISNDPELLSVFVIPDFQKRGIGRRLVGELETKVKESGYQQLSAIYMTGSPGAETLERLLISRLWSPPELRMRIYKGDLKEFMSAPWYSNSSPPGFQFFCWREVKPSELRRLKISQLNTGWIPSSLTPWSYDIESSDAYCSLGIRFHGDIVGWILTHRLPGDTLRITCAFIRGDLGRLGRSLPALSESLRRALSSGFKRIVFAVSIDNPHVIRFAERRFKPWLSECAETRGCSKKFAS